MRGNQAHLALMIDEFGTTTGLVAFNQLISHVVGQIDRGAMDNVIVAGGSSMTYQGRMPVLEANVRLSLTIPHGPYRRVAGSILAQLGHMATEGGSVVHKRRRLSAQRTHGPYALY